MNHSGTNIGDLVRERRRAFCCTPEINLSINEVDRAFEQILNEYEPRAVSVDHFDGLSFEMPGSWRFSLCRSKTEDVVRLNLESRGRVDTLLNEGAELLYKLEAYKTDHSDWHDKLKIQ